MISAPQSHLAAESSMMQPYFRASRAGTSRARLFGVMAYTPAPFMPRRSPHGNLTAALVVVALLEFVFHRLVGRLFLSPGCSSALSCLLPRLGPYFLFLSGVLATGLLAVALARLLERGELFPRGVRFAIAVFSTVFLLIVSWSLIYGRAPERYQTHLETSFGFVVLLMLASVAGHSSPPAAPRGGLSRAKVGFALFALPSLLHLAAAMSLRVGWLREGSPGSSVLVLLAEGLWLLAGIASPALLLIGQTSRARLATALGFAAGSSAFFFVALLGRYDLIQTLALYGLRLELPHAMTMMGFGYALALFGFVTTTTALLLKPGGARLTGLGLCLLGLAGFQTSSPVELSLALCGLLAMATGIVRGVGEGPSFSDLSPGRWRAVLGSVTMALADPQSPEMEPSTIQVLTGDDAGSDDSRIHGTRRSHKFSLRFVRGRGRVDSFRAEVGTPGDDTPDATIESHERWLARRPEERPGFERVRTGDMAFDRRLGVYGEIALGDHQLRRKLLHHADGSFTFWRGRAARFITVRDGRSGRIPSIIPETGSPSTPAIVEVLDTLIELVELEETPASPLVPPGPPAPPVRPGTLS
jgi:hypothetical protein